MAGAAVLVAVSTTGGAVAGGMVTGEKIKNYTISQKDLKAGAVNTRVIADSTVKPEDLAAATLAALKGQAAADGARWLTGAGAPGSRAARDGDWYLDTASQDVWTRTAGAWTLVVNLRGATGAPGARGADGPAGATGSSGTNGTNGTNGSAGAPGADGTSWLTGAGAPSSGGVEGDLYLNTTNGDVHRKGASTWGSAIANIEGAAGANGTDGQGVPTGGTSGQVLSKVSGTDHDTRWTTPGVSPRRLVFAVATSSPTTVVSGQDVAMNFSNEYSDPGASFSGNTFTAPAAGSYSFRAEVRVDESSSDLGAAIGLVLQKTAADGTYLDDVYHGARVVPSDEGGWAEVTAIIDLTAVEQVRVFATSVGGTTHTRPGDISRIQVYRLS